MSTGFYYLATVHRPSNTDIKENLSSIIKAFSELKLPVAFPVHPKTSKYLKLYNIDLSDYSNIIPIEPQ